MKLATWNVNSGTVERRLAELQAVFPSDIVALQETANPPDYSAACFWAGDIEHKGLSLSTNLKAERFEVVGDSSPAIAARVLDPMFGEFNLLHLWAKPTPTYFADLMRTIDLYERSIRQRPTVILGDFNMTARLRSNGRHFYTLNGRLNGDLNVHSVYHEITNEKFGMESMTTLYHQWGSSGCYHCDFIYVPADWLPSIRSVTIPGYTSLSTSDHRPVICELIR